jgi:hypothetical protein
VFSLLLLIRAFVKDGHGFSEACLYGKIQVCCGVRPFGVMKYEKSIQKVDHI